MLETGTRPTRFQVVFEVERCEKPKRNILDILGIGVQCIRDSDALRTFSLQEAQIENNTLDESGGFLCVVHETHPDTQVAKWNEAHPGYAVESGQIIVQVNGDRESIKDLFEMSTLNKVVELSLVRPSQGPAGVIPRPMAAKCCEPLKVILLSGLRASGKSTLGRALNLMLDLRENRYLDLDEQRTSGMMKYKHFYETCINEMLCLGGVWIVDKLGPHPDEARKIFLERVWLAAEKSVLLNLAHSNLVHELRMCYARFSRRGTNHRDPAVSAADVFQILSSEQAQRRGRSGKLGDALYLRPVEEHCLQRHTANLEIKATPFQIVLQALGHLFNLGITSKEEVGNPLGPVINEALEASVKVEQNIAGRQIGLDDISMDDLEKICNTPLPFEWGSRHKDRPWMSIVRQNSNIFLQRVGILHDGLFYDVVAEDKQLELYDKFCYTCEQTLPDCGIQWKQCLMKWLEHEDVQYVHEQGDDKSKRAYGCLQHIAKKTFDDFKATLDELQLEILNCPEECEAFEEIRNHSAASFETLSNEDRELLKNTLDRILSGRTAAEHKDALPGWGGWR